jgi:GT2 family glycosyltransferase
VVPHYDQVEPLAICLESLLDQTVPRGSYEVLVVDNGSTQSLEPVRRRFGRDVRFLHEPEKGAAPARNRGMAAARGDRLLFTDADCRVARDWIAACASGLDRAPLTGGRIEVTAAPSAERSAAEWFEIVFAFQQRLYVERKGFSATANLAVRREVAEAVGPFRGGLSEDVDWCWRARDAGYRMAYLDDAVVHHPARRTLEELRRKWLRLSSEDIRLRRAYGQSRGAIALRQLAVAVSPLVHARRVLGRRDLGPAAKARALGVLAYIRLYRAAVSLRLLTEAPGREPVPRLGAARRTPA